MVVKALIRRNSYQDSVALMRISTQVRRTPGVRQVSVMMGTPQNKEVLREARLFNDQVAAAKPSDLIAVADTEDEASAARVMQLVEKLLKNPQEGRHDEPSGGERLTCLEDAASELPGANLVVISTPGEFAAAEALKALKKGLHVFVFSNNVSLDDEVALKEYAHQHDLLMMGPDCGTSYISGVPLGFVNRVKPGNIGIVGASGTGIQEIMCLIDRLGGGVSQVIGTGSRDLSLEVGGTTMLDALGALASDNQTDVIVVVSKPPAAEVADRVVRVLENVTKPVVVCFLGSSLATQSENVQAVETLEAAALKAVSVSSAHAAQSSLGEPQASQPHRRGGRYIRGLYSGGTLAGEALMLLHKSLPVVHSNLARTQGERLVDANKSVAHTIVDMGSDEFTLGKPHPMIDLTTRIERIRREAADPEAGVIILDVVLGFGSHSNPASELAPVIKDVVEGDGPSVVVHVVGTSSDPQNYEAQVDKLRAAGALIAESNVRAVQFALNLIEDEQAVEGVTK